MDNRPKAMRETSFKVSLPIVSSILHQTVSQNVAAAKSLQSYPTLCDPIDRNHQAPPSLGFSRQGVGCHFLLQCMNVKSESEVAQSCPTLCDRMDCSLPGSSVHGIFQARVLEWGAIAFSANNPAVNLKMKNNFNE